MLDDDKVGCADSIDNHDVFFSTGHYAWDYPNGFGELLPDFGAPSNAHPIDLFRIEVFFLFNL